MAIVRMRADSDGERTTRAKESEEGDFISP